MATLEHIWTLPHATILEILRDYNVDPTSNIDKDRIHVAYIYAEHGFLNDPWVGNSLFERTMLHFGMVGAEKHRAALRDLYIMYYSLYCVYGMSRAHTEYPTANLADIYAYLMKKRAHPYNIPTTLVSPNMWNLTNDFNWKIISIAQLSKDIEENNPHLPGGISTSLGLYTESATSYTQEGGRIKV